MGITLSKKAGKGQGEQEGIKGQPPITRRRRRFRGHKCVEGQDKKACSREASPTGRSRGRTGLSNDRIQDPAGR